MKVIATCIEIDGEIGMSVECAEPDEDAAWVRAYCDLVDSVAWKNDAHYEVAKALAKAYSETGSQEDLELLNIQLLNHTIPSCHWCIERTQLHYPRTACKASPDGRWLNDELQFPRLISELEAVGGFTTQALNDLSEEMDVPIASISELIDRAQEKWEHIKADLYADNK